MTKPPANCSKFFALLSISFLAISQIAAQKLKYDVDKNTGDTIYHTKEERVYTKSGRNNAVSDLLKSTIYKSPTGYRIALLIQTGRTNNFSISAGSGITFQLDDGSTVTGITRVDNRSRVSSLAYGSFMYCHFHLNAEAVRQLKKSPVSTISIQSSSGEMYYELKGKLTRVIADQLDEF